MSFNHIMDATEYVHDFALAPMAAQDGGHYLFEPSLKDRVIARPALYQNWRKKARTRLEKADRGDKSWMMLVDAQYRMVFTVDRLVWEEQERKYRIHLHSGRIGGYCPKGVEDLWGEMMGRMMLATVGKGRMNSWILDDWCWIGNRRVHRASREERRRDVRLINQLRAILSGMEFLLPEESLGFLYPNHKADYSGTPLALSGAALKKKEEAVIRLRDTSMIWQCGLARRERLRREGVFRWDDPRFLSRFQPMVYSRIETIRRMIELSSSHHKSVDLPSRHAMASRFPGLLDSPLDSWVFVDFETDFQKCIYLLGWSATQARNGWEWGTAISLSSERLLMDRIYVFLSRHQEAGGRVAYYFAEDRFWRERCRVHNLPHYMNLFRYAIDLHLVLEQGPVLVQGVFSFKLKAIAAGLFRLGHIDIQQPEGCADGAESVALAHRYFQTKDPMLQQTLENYNRFDCDILLELVRFLRRNLV